MTAPVGAIGRPALAAITFSPRGGGIAAVSRLVRQVLRDEVPATRCFELATDDGRFESSTIRRLAFGAQMALAQVRRHCDWTFYTHLHLAAVQRAIPSVAARPYAVFLHDVEAWSPLTQARRDVLAGAFLRLANSPYTAGRVAAAHPGCGPVVACPLGAVSPAAAGDTAPARPEAIGPRTVLVVGRMTATDAYKGHDQLIEAWPDVLARVPDATLVCVGEGDDVARLRAKAAAAGVGAAVIFTGFVDEPARTAFYRNAVALAMPSRREGFGLVYVEAMAAGLPCIGSIHDAARDVIVDGETGFLVDQADRGALVERLVALLTDDGLRRRLGAAGLARYEAIYTYDVFRGRLLRAISEALPATVVRPRGRRAGMEGA